MDASILQDFGLATAVIAALFYMMHKFIEDNRAIREEHKDERAEWRASQELRDERMDKTIIGLTSAINNLSQRHRVDD